MKNIRIVRIVYLDCRGLSQGDIEPYVNGVRETFDTDMHTECQENQKMELILVPVRSETRIEHVILDLDQVKVSKVMEYDTLEELRREYPVA